MQDDGAAAGLAAGRAGAAVAAAGAGGAAFCEESGGSVGLGAGGGVQAAPKRVTMVRAQAARLAWVEGRKASSSGAGVASPVATHTAVAGVGMIA